MKTVTQASFWLCTSVVLLGSGCAVNRGVLDIRVPERQNPASGTTVAITRVTDKRVFEAASANPSTPSVMGGQIGNPAITARAIARKRNTYGQALGDILLPEGRTVEDLIRKAMTNAFRDAGYRVLESSTASSETCIPVEAEVEQFWSWVTPGFWAIALECETKVKITGNVPPFQNGSLVRGYVQMRSQAAGSAQWQNTINKGIEAFAEELRKQLGKQ
jgi:hypothetical protein